MKIVMVGPVWPFRGGIAQYTGAMCATLSARHEVRVHSYAMQYPKLLYKSPQRDPENTTFRFEPADYPINTMNPVTWRKTAAMIRREKPDLVIAQWWHPWFAPCYAVLFRRMPCPVVFVCHNVLPHEGFPMKEALTRRVLSKGDAFIVHSQQDADDLKRLVRDPFLIHAVHPAYNQFRKRGISKEEARRELGIPPEQEILLFFGYIREYKGLKHLIRALPEIRAARPEARLFVVGDFFEHNRETYELLIRDTDMNDAVTLVDGYLPDDQVEAYFAAADLCVLPYESATQSGVIQIAYSFRLPVVATAVGGLPEVVLDGRTGFVVPPKDPSALASAVVRFFAENRAEVFAGHIVQENERYSWDRMTEHVESIMSHFEDREPSPVLSGAREGKA